MYCGQKQNNNNIIKNDVNTKIPPEKMRHGTKSCHTHKNELHLGPK